MDFDFVEYREVQKELGCRFESLSCLSTSHSVIDVYEGINKLLISQVPPTLFKVYLFIVCCYMATEKHNKRILWESKMCYQLS